MRSSSSNSNTLPDVRQKLEMVKSLLQKQKAYCHETTQMLQEHAAEEVAHCKAATAQQQSTINKMMDVVDRSSAPRSGNNAEGLPAHHALHSRLSIESLGFSSHDRRRAEDQQTTLDHIQTISKSASLLSVPIVDC